MNAQIIIVDENKKNFLMISSFLLDLDKNIKIIEAKDGLAATLKFKNQNFDYLIINNSITKRNTLNLLEEIVFENKTKKENIIILYDKITQEELKSFVVLGIKTFISLSQESNIIREKFLLKQPFIHS